MSILDRAFRGPSDLAVCEDLCDYLSERLSEMDSKRHPLPIWPSRNEMRFLIGLVESQSIYLRIAQAKRDKRRKT